MSNKFNKIWLKELNSHIFKVGRLNWFKVSKKINSNFTWKFRDRKYI